MLPDPIVNRRFMQDFTAEDAPCAAIGIAEDDQGRCGMIALRLATVLPRAVAEAGFALGNGLFGTRDWQVLHLPFNFYGFQIYNLLINPAVPAIKTALKTIVATEDYIFLALDSNQAATAFRLQTGPNTESGLIGNLASARKSTTSSAQYEHALRRFTSNPEPPGVQLQWICRQEDGLLEPSMDPLRLAPTYDHRGDRRGPE